jgi:flagellar biosynthesis protein FliQ
MDQYSYSYLIVQSFISVWNSIFSFLPKIIVAIIFILIGILMGYAIGEIVRKIVEAIKLDEALRKLNFEKYLEKAGYVLNSGRFLGSVVYWIFVIIGFLAAFEALGLPIATNLLKELVLYIPKVVVAVVIFIGAILVGEVLGKLAKATIKGAGHWSSEIIYRFVYWTFFVFGALTALYELGISQNIIQIIIGGFVAMLALAGGLAFGLGGKEIAQKFLESIKFRK